MIAKAAADVGGQQPSYQRLQAAEALLRRKGSAGPVELPGSVSVYRLSLAQLEAEAREGMEAGDEADAGTKEASAGAAGPRGGARCGKLVFRLSKPTRL